MAMDSRFLRVAASVEDPGMGTENAAPLLYSFVSMLRPRSVLAVGLGYTTLFLLQALADADAASSQDRAILAGTQSNPSRREVLFAADEDLPVHPVLVGIDDFSDNAQRLEHLLRCVEHLELHPYLELHRCRYQDAGVPASRQPFGLVWIDCAHQLDYPDLLNRFWPMVDEDGGMLLMHYTYVDLVVPAPDGEQHVMVAGPTVNAAKKQLLEAGLEANFELLSIVEPHKFRQGSVTILRKLPPLEQCRTAGLADELHALYGANGCALDELNHASG